jgi:uncharacterized protein YecE (DUF72 family)
MTTFHIGCAGFSAARSRYARKLAFVEIDVGKPAPAPKVLERWRTEVGEAMVWSVVTPASFWGERDWPLRDEKATTAEIDRLVNVVKPLAARAVVLRTPASIRPGTVAAKRFVAVAERVRKMAPVVAWEPGGLWERDDAQELVAGTGVIVVADPLRDDVENESVVYARMRGLGSDRRYHAGRLEEIVVALANCEEAFIVFDTQESFAEATRLRKLIEGLAREDADDEADDDVDDEEGESFAFGGDDEDESDESDGEDDEDEDEDDEDSDDADEPSEDEDDEDDEDD